MKNLIMLGFILFLCLIPFINAVPKIEPYVNDYGNLLTREQISSLNILADKIEQNTTWEIAIVTVPNTEGLDRLDYANRLGDENGVGKKDKDNGLVVLWSESDDRGLAIASGRYSESIFNDAKLGRILREARSYFDEGNYYEGFLNITLELEKEIKDTNNTPSTDTDGDFFIFILIGGMVIIFIIWAVFHSSGSESESSYSGSSYSGSSSSGSFGGRSSGSFGGFGGGSFGGGGSRG